MSDLVTSNLIKVYSQACVYHITLQGRITPTLLHYLDDLQVREGEDGEINVIGWLPDQSALIGLLQSLNNIRYGILSIKAIIDK